MRLLLLALLAWPALAGCLDEPVPPQVEWTQVPAQADAGEQFQARYRVSDRGGFDEAVVAVWAAEGASTPATLAHYTVSLDPTPGIQTPPSCPSNDQVKYTECAVNDLLVLQEPGTYWVRVRAVVDGVEAWSPPVRVVAS